MPFIACRTNTQQKLQRLDNDNPSLKKGLPSTVAQPLQKATPQDARVHYPIHKQPTHQPRPPHPPVPGSLRRRQEAIRPAADASGLNSVPTPNWTNQRANSPLTTGRPGSTPHHTQDKLEHSTTVLRPTRDAGRSFIDDSTSETPPCVIPRTGMIGARAP